LKKLELLHHTGITIPTVGDFVGDTLQIGAVMTEALLSPTGGEGEINVSTAPMNLWELAAQSPSTL